MSSVKTGERDREYEQTKRLYVGAAAAIIGGLAVAGSLDRATGGVILLVGWIAGVMGLHRMGRAGSVRRDAEPVADPKDEAES